MSYKLHANNIYPNIFVVFISNRMVNIFFNWYLDPGFSVSTTFKKAVSVVVL